MRLLTMLYSILFAGAACGGGGPTSYGGGGGMPPPPPPGGSVVSATIQDFSFGPSALTVKVGTTVKWTNNGPSAHTATSDMGVWDSGTLGAPGGGGYGGTPGGSYQFAFTQAGTYSYHCKLHPPSLYPSFTGTVTVTP